MTASHLPYRVIPATPATGRRTGPWAVHLIGPRGGNNVYLGRVTHHFVLDGYAAERAVTHYVGGFRTVEHVPAEQSLLAPEPILFPTREAAAEAVWQAWRMA